MSPLRIANGQGFWGDLPQAPRWQIEHGPVDVLCLEYLAEVTMGILARMNQSGREGYISDFLEQMNGLWEQCLAKNITVVTSAGGLAPEACARDLNDHLQSNGHDASIAYITGDDCFDRLDDWRRSDTLGDSDRQFLDQQSDAILSANRYLGSQGIAKAYAQDADVIIAGRVTDTALVLGPAMAEFGWDPTDYNRLARGIAGGHLLECGGQATGGNMTGANPDEVDLWNLGFPIASIKPDGSLTITKHESLGGVIDRRSVGQQLVYELTEPDAYKTPDVTVDFRDVELEQTQQGVAVRGIRGSAPPDTDKVSVLYQDGYQVSGHLTYCGPDPIQKSEQAEAILRNRLDELDATPEKLQVENVGYDACHRERSIANPDRQDEILFRVAAHDSSENCLEQVGKQLMGLLLTGPDGATGFSEGRPRPKPVIRHYGLYVDRQPDVQTVHWCSTND